MMQHISITSQTSSDLHHHAHKEPVQHDVERDPEYIRMMGIHGHTRPPRTSILDRRKFSSDVEVQTDECQTIDILSLLQQVGQLTSEVNTAKRSVAECRSEFFREHKGNVEHAMQEIQKNLSHSVRSAVAQRSKAIERQRSIEHLRAAQDAAMSAATHSREMEALRNDLCDKHEIEVHKMKDRIRILVSHIAILEATLAERKPSATRNQVIVTASQSGANGDLPGMFDFASLEDIGGIRLRMEQLQEEKEVLAAANTKLKMDLLRATTQTKSMRTRMVQQRHEYAQSEKKLLADVDILRSKCAALELELNSPTSDSGQLRQEITARVKAQMTELAIAESKRSAEREKKNQLSLKDAHTKDLEKVRNSGLLDLRKADDKYRQRIALLQEKHWNELEACDRRWQKKFDVVQSAVDALDNKHLSNAILTTHSRILQSAAVLFPNGATMASPPHAKNDSTRLPML
eukprot:m.194947 g.194947  ORF g.194947 m.194947 type:complete len:461 (+) comp18671_c0_seq2:267-1649(+)